MTEEQLGELSLIKENVSYEGNEMIYESGHVYVNIRTLNRV